MAASRKPTTTTGKGRSGDPGAMPDGRIHRTQGMRDALGQFRELPCPSCGFVLSQSPSLAESLDHFTRHPASAWQQRPARLRMLELHGIGALELFFEPTPRKDTVADLLAIHDAGVVRFLVGQVRHLAYRNALVRLAGRWPLLVLRELLATQPARHQAGAALVLELLAAHPEWQAPLEAACDEAGRKALARLQAGDTDGLTDAEPALWPAFLRQPPWKNPQARPSIPVLALSLDALAQPARLHWQHAVPNRHEPVRGEPAQWLAEELRQARERSDWRMKSDPGLPLEWPPAVQGWDTMRKALWMLGLRPERVEAVARSQGADLRPEDFGAPPSGAWGAGDYLWQLPAPLAAAVFAHMPPWGGATGEARHLRPLLRHLGTAALPGLPGHLGQGSRAMFDLAAVIEWDRLADWIARGFHANRWVRQEAGGWLARYPDAAARGLLPTALGEPGAARDAAQAALRWLAQAGHGPSVCAQAVAYGPEAVEALQRLLAIAPEDLLPETLPVLPRSLPLSTLPRLALAADRSLALPQAAVPDVLMALALSRPEAPYPGVAALQAVVAPDALARFGRALLAWWIANGRPARERWMFALQGRLGDDETARQLFSLLRQWRVALDRVRAYDALAMLGEIGSDAALMHLGELARQTRHDDLRTRASALLDEVAQQRGLSLGQLADRTVPDLGLDARGRLALDFGARRFEVGMDDRLQPVLRDAAGKTLKTLPRPNAADDPVLAPAAAEQLKELRRMAKTVAATQLHRLEAAMCEQRRWEAGEFLAFVARHPVMRVFARQLVWGVFDPAGDRLAATFRVGAEGELADLRDEPFELAGEACIGIPHPLELKALDPGLAAAWTPLFADYEIVQPFEQLGRPHFVLDPPLRERRDLPAWQGRTISNAGLLGLESRGWRREVGDGGMVCRFSRAVDASLTVGLRVDAGWFVQEAPDPKGLQSVAEVALDGPEGCRFGDVAAIAWSEVERDLQRAVWPAPA